MVVIAAAVVIVLAIDGVLCKRWVSRIVEDFTISKTMGEIGVGPSDLLNEAELAAAAEEKEIHAFEIDLSQVDCL
ncbi:hypothetical protein FF1_041196 [Malus domestica]